MYWVKIWKKYRQSSYMWSNDYYADPSFEYDGEKMDFLDSAMKYDAAFNNTSSTIFLATLMTNGDANSCAMSNGWVYAPKSQEYHGKIHDINILPFRWTLQTAMHRKMGNPAHHLYRYAVNMDELKWNDLGYVVYKPNDWFKGPCEAYLNDSAALFKENMRIGFGPGNMGAAAGFEAPIGHTPIGITVTNRSRKQRALRIKDAMGLQERILGSLYEITQKWYTIYEPLHIDYPDFYDVKMKADTKDIMSAVQNMAEDIKQFHANLPKKDDGNDPTWETRYGPTLGSLKGNIGQVKKKFEDDSKQLEKLTPFPFFDGESYFHRDDAHAIAAIAEDWMQIGIGYSYFDWENGVQPNLGEIERMDDYSWCDPDSEVKVDCIIAQPKIRGKRVYPSGLLGLVAK